MRRLTATQVLERLHTTRRILEAVHGCARVQVDPTGEPWRSGHAVVEAIAVLERYAAVRLRRKDVAAYAADLGAYARVVLGEWLAAAP